MAAVTVQINGLKELEAKLEDMKGPAVKRIIRKGLDAGASVIQAAIAAEAPERVEIAGGDALPPGALRRDIARRFVEQDKDGLPAFIIGPGKYTAYIANWVEYGHRLVKGGYSSMKRGKLQGSGHQVGDVPAHPFVRPAFEASAKLAMDAAVTKITQEVEKEAAKR